MAKNVNEGDLITVIPQAFLSVIFVPPINVYDTCAYLLTIIITLYNIGKVDKKVLQAQKRGKEFNCRSIAKKQG